MKNRAPRKLKMIENSHAMSESIVKNENVIRIDEENWSVKSACKNYRYHISLVRGGPPCCNLSCEVCTVCVHMYRCTCIDNVMRFNLCKHIHACCQFSKAATATAALDMAPDDGFNTVKNFPSPDKSILNTISITRDTVLKCDLIKANVKDKELPEINAKKVSSFLDKALHEIATNQQPSSSKSLPNLRRKQIEPQQFFSTRKKKQIEKQHSLSSQSRELLRKELSVLDGSHELTNVHHQFDHSY